MTTWMSEELHKIGTVEEDHVTPTRRHDAEPTPIWVVRIGDDVYVRSVNGRTSVGFRRTQVRHEGRIRASGVEIDVTFVNAQLGLNDQIDDGYRAKYRHYPAQYVNHVVGPVAGSATIKLVPR